MTSVASAPSPAPRLTLKSSSCSIATLPVSRTRHGRPAASSRAAIARMSAIAAAAGCMRLKSTRRLQHDEAARRRARLAAPRRRAARPKRTSASRVACAVDRARKLRIKGGERRRVAGRRPSTSRARRRARPRRRTAPQQADQRLRRGEPVRELRASSAVGKIQETVALEELAFARAAAASDSARARAQLAQQLRPRTRRRAPASARR